MKKAEILFLIGKSCPDKAGETMALLKRLDGDDEFSAPWKEINEMRFAKLCRDALEEGEFTESIRGELEAIWSGGMISGNQAQMRKL